jgi:hypothetical protein
MSEYDDIIELQTTGCWPNRTEPEWAVEIASRLDVCSTHTAVINSGLKREIERLREANEQLRREREAYREAGTNLYHVTQSGLCGGDGESWESCRDEIDLEADMILQVQAAKAAGGEG